MFNALASWKALGRRVLFSIFIVSLAIGSQGGVFAELARAEGEVAPTFSVETWKDGQTKMVLSFDAPVVGAGGSALTAEDFVVSGANVIGIASVDHEPYSDEAVVTLAGNLDSSASDFSIACAADAVYDEDEVVACADTVTVGVYDAPEDTAGPSFQFADFLSATQVAVEFDERVDASTMVSGNFVLTSSDADDDTSITGVESFDDGAILTASAANLGFGSGNTVQISSSITDVVGNAYAGSTETILPILVISEVKVASTTNASDEFVEIFNPSESSFDMGSTGSQTVYLHLFNGTTDVEVPLSLFTTSIPAGGYFLVGTSQTTSTTALDATYSTADGSLGANGAAYISLSATADEDVIDLVGWGTSTLAEGSPVAAPGAGESIERKALEDSTAADMASGGEDEFSGNSEDSNDNADDFVEQATPVPQGSESLTEFAAGESFNGGGDTESPGVLYSYPDASVSNVEESLDSIFVLFTETMDTDTLSAPNVTLTAASDPGTNLADCVYDPRSMFGSYLDCDIEESALPLDPEETYTFTMTTGVTDFSGNPLASAYTFDFTVTEGFSFESSETPYVWGSYPYAGEQSFSSNSQYLYLYFSMEMDTSTLTPEFITLENVTDGTDEELGTVTPFTSYYTNDAVYIDVTDVDFQAGDEYELTAGAELSSADGVTMGFPYVISFTVGSTDDTTPPNVIGSTPYEGQEDVFVGTSYFSVSIDDTLSSTDVTTESVRLMNGETAVDAEVAYNAGWGQIELTIDDVLEPNAEYELRLTADPDEDAITSVTGAALVDGDGTADGVHRISFTTGDGDEDAPTVSYATATQSRVYVTYSEGMNEDNVTDLSNYTLESPTGTAVTLSELSGASAFFDDENNTATIEGLALTADATFTISVSGVTDRSGNIIDPLFDEASGTVYDEAEYDPGDTSYSGESWEMPHGFDEGSYGYVPQASAWPSNSLAGFASSYSIYIPVSSQVPSGDDNGKVVVTFPAGTDVSGAANPTWSWSNADANYYAPGTIEVESITADADARTVTIEFSESTACDDGNDFPCDGSEFDSLSFEIDGIVNPTTPRGYGTEGYSVDVQTMSGSTLLESFISYPYYISEAGDSTLTLTLNATGAEEGTAIVEGYGWATGSFSFESGSFSGGTATATMEGMPDGDYWLWTAPQLDLDGDDEIDYVGQANPIYVTVEGNTTAEMTFTDIGSLAEVTVNVTGATGKNVDVSAYGAGWQSDQIESTTGDDEVELHLADGDWWVQVWPHYDSSVGYVTPDYITPQAVYVRVEGGEVSEDSGTEDDGIVEMALVAADNEIPFEVVDQDDLPIANAWVWVSDVNNGFWSSGQTTIDGELTLNVNAGTFRMGVYVEGMPPSEERSMTVSEDGEIFLDGSDTASELVTLVSRVPTNAISGTVSDGASLVSGASVYAFCTDGCVGNNYSWSMTDTNGTYTFFVDNGTWQVGAYIPGYGSAEEQTVVIADSDESGVTLQPDPDAVFYTISGTVCEAEEGADDCDGADGLSNVYINVWSGETGGGWNYATTGSDGSYEVRVPAAEGYRVDAWDNTLGSLLGLSGVDVSSGDVTGADIVVTEPEEVELRIEDADGNPYEIDNLWGEAVNVETGGSAYFNVQSTDSTTIMLQPGDYELHLHASEAGLDQDDIASDDADTAYADGILTVDGAESVVVTMPELFVLRGGVNDEDGNPVSNAWIELSDTDSDLHSGVLTGEDGSYEIDVEEGTYQVMVYYPGLIVDPVDITISGNTTRNFAGSAADFTISGTVVTSEDEPVPFAFVVGADSDGTTSVAQADENGAFDLWVDEETWTLTANGYGYEPSEAQDVEVSTADVTGVELALGAAVDLEDPVSTSITPSAGGVVSDEDIGIDVLVPENALGTSSTSNSTLSITETNNAPDTETTDVIGNGIEVDVTDSTGSAVTQFSDDLTYTWTMTVEEMAEEGVDTLAEVEELRISYYDSSGAWISGATTVTYFDEADALVTEPADDLSNVSYVNLTAAFDHTTLFAVTSSSDATESSDSSDSSDSDDSSSSGSGGGGGGGGSSRSRSTSDDDDEDESETEDSEDADEADEDGDESSGSDDDGDDEGDDDGEDERDEQIASIVSEADEDEYLSSASAMAAMVSAARDVLKEFATVDLLVSKVTGGTSLPSDMVDYRSLVNFVTYGTPVTLKLGSGERAGVVSSFKSAFGRLPSTNEDWADAIKIAVGRWPTQRSESSEAAAKASFAKIYLREADMSQPNDNAAVTVMSYGLRPSARNLGSEAVAVGFFRDIFGRAPTSAADWDAVRAIAYSGAVR